MTYLAELDLMYMLIRFDEVIVAAISPDRAMIPTTSTRWPQTRSKTPSRRSPRPPGPLRLPGRGFFMLGSPCLKTNLRKHASLAYGSDNFSRVIDSQCNTEPRSRDRDVKLAGTFLGKVCALE